MFLRINSLVLVFQQREAPRHEAGRNLPQICTFLANLHPEKTNYGIGLFSQLLTLFQATNLTSLSQTKETRKGPRRTPQVVSHLRDSHWHQLHVAWLRNALNTEEGATWVRELFVELKPTDAIRPPSAWQAAQSHESDLKPECRFIVKRNNETFCISIWTI